MTTEQREHEHKLFEDAAADGFEDLTRMGDGYFDAVVDLAWKYWLKRAEIAVHE